MDVPLDNPAIMHAILTEMEEMGYMTITICFDQMGDEGYFVVIPDGQGDIVFAECASGVHEQGHPVQYGPIPWKRPEDWAIIQTYIDQAKDMAGILDAVDVMAKTYSDLRTEFRRVAQQNVVLDSAPEE